MDTSLMVDQITLRCELLSTGVTLAQAQSAPLVDGFDVPIQSCLACIGLLAEGALQLIA